MMWQPWKFTHFSCPTSWEQRGRTINHVGEAMPEGQRQRGRRCGRNRRWAGSGRSKLMKRTLKTQKSACYVNGDPQVEPVWRRTQDGFNLDVVHAVGGFHAKLRKCNIFVNCICFQTLRKKKFWYFDKLIKFFFIKKSQIFVRFSAVPAQTM